MSYFHVCLARSANDKPQTAFEELTVSEAPCQSALFSWKPWEDASEKDMQVKTRGLMSTAFFAILFIWVSNT